jgi:exodeoxyribonuclease-5
LTAAGITPSDAQARVLREVEAWLDDPHGPQWKYLAGYAGVGKTSIVRILQDKYRVAYAAYTGKAAHVLRSKGCEGATTLHKFLYRPEERVVTAPDGSAAYSTEFIALPLDESPTRGLDVVVLDECSMADTRLATDLLSYGTRVLVTGDPFQLPPINGEGYFTRREPDWVLTEVHRQARDSGILRLATDVREGRGIGARDSYAPDAAVISLEEAEEQESDLLDWCDVVLVGTHRWRHHFNRRYRERQGFRGHYPEIGDQLVCLQNDHKRGLLNGSIWRCESPSVVTGHQRLTMLLREVEGDRHAAITAPPTLVEAWAHDFVGEEAEFEKWPWRRRAERARFAYGYAITVHKSQGSEFSRVLALDEGSVFREHAARWQYTQITRAAKQLVLVRR